MKKDRRNFFRTLAAGAAGILVPWKWIADLVRPPIDFQREIERTFDLYCELRKNAIILHVTQEILEESIAALDPYLPAKS